MNVSSEFETVALILSSSADTRGVDAFSLAVIKAERQIRKLFTYLVFQYPCFADSDIGALRDVLAKNKRVYFKGIENGINCISPYTVEQLVGTKYGDLRSRVEEAISYRNKIFHGQLTQKFLSREELVAFVMNIREWCEALAAESTLRVGYDGFARNSFQKSKIHGLAGQFKVQFSGIKSYEQFIQQHMHRL